MNDYDKIFNDEIERILSKLYNEPMKIGGGTGINRIVISTEKKYIDYLVEQELVRNLGYNTPSWSLQLERKGFEVFEKYKGWYDYKKNVIDKKSTVENAKNLAARFWWVSFLISILSLILSLFNFIKK